jgi:hypothetical protein
MYDDKTPADNSYCDVRIDGDKIAVFYDDGESVVWHGIEKGAGHFELHLESGRGHASLHRFDGGCSWVTPGLRPPQALQRALP